MSNQFPANVKRFWCGPTPPIQFICGSTLNGQDLAMSDETTVNECHGGIGVGYLVGKCQVVAIMKKALDSPYKHYSFHGFFS